MLQALASAAYNFEGLATPEKCMQHDNPQLVKMVSSMMLSLLFGHLSVHCMRCYNQHVPQDAPK